MCRKIQTILEETRQDTEALPDTAVVTVYTYGNKKQWKVILRIENGNSRHHRYLLETEK